MSATRPGWCSWHGERLTLIRSGPASGVPFLPVAGLAHRLLQHPAAERHDQPGVLGERDEPVGAEHAVLRVAASAPAPRRRARCRRRGATSGWYSMKNSPRSRAAGSAVVSPCRVMARASASGSASSKRLPPADLARYIVMSALRSTSAAPRSPGRALDDADAAAHGQLAAVDADRGGQRVQDAAGEVVDLALGVGAGGQGHELVAAEPGDHLAGRGRAATAAGRRPRPAAGRRPRGRGCR